MRLRSWRGTTVVSSTPRRPFPWIRLTLAIAVLGILAYIFVPDLYSVRADALVRGDLIPVGSIYRVRIDKLMVHCTDRVREGQPVAVVSNFLLQADYQREYLQGLEQAQVATISLEQNVATARENAESLHQRYLAAAADLQRLKTAFVSYDAAYRAGALPKVDWDAKRGEIQGSEDVTQGALHAWNAAKLYVDQIIAMENSKVGSYQQLLTQARSTAQQVSQAVLRAPVTGDIIECVERPQNVIEPGTPLFSIFQPDRAYIVAYFSPNNISKVHIGQEADVRISGIPKNIVGRVAWIYPDLDALPPELTRFFWEHVQFSQYHPVKITLEALPEDERQQVYYGAQARVSISTTQRDAK